MRRRTWSDSWMYPFFRKKSSDQSWESEDPRTDQRISFVGGSHKAAELAEIAGQNRRCSLVMYPTSMEDLMKIADENKLMPQNPPGLSQKLQLGCLYISYNLPKMLLFTLFTATRFAMHRIYANRINSRGMSRVFCDLRSQKTPRGILPVNSNRRCLIKIL